MFPRLSVVTIALTIAAVAGAQAPATADSIVPSLPPRTPLPPEASTAGVTRFSFITYGDTRGRQEGKDTIAGGLDDRAAAAPDGCTYGDVVFQDNTFVTLQPGGLYQLCSFHTGQSVTVNVIPGTEIRVVMNFELNSFLSA